MPRVREARLPLIASSLLQAEVYSTLSRERVTSLLADVALSRFAWVAV